MSTLAPPPDRGAWERLSASPRPEGRAFIAGRPVATRDGRVFEDISPIDSQSIIAHRVSAALRGGTVWVNAFDRSTMATPFSGFKLSDSGRDRSLHAIDKYCDLKTIWTAYA